MIIMGLLGYFMALLCQGPSLIFNFPDSVYLILLSQGLIGIVSPMTTLPILPEMMESAKPHFSKELESEINDISSVLF